MTQKTRKRISFNLFLSPDGTVEQFSDSHVAMIRRIAEEMFELPGGGMITMSTDVNATVGKGFISLAKGLLRTWYQRIMKNLMADKEMKRIVEERGMDTGWSVGNLYRGRFYDKETGDVFNEKSFSIEIKGVPFDFIKDVAKALMKKFDQKAVILDDYDKNRHFVYSN